MCRQVFRRAIPGALALVSLCRVASADLIPFAYLSFDVTVPRMTARFDITNQTGPNSTVFPDGTWPVTTPVGLTITSLTVDFNDGSTTVFSASYFSLGTDGLSLVGNMFDVSAGHPLPTSASLVGLFSASDITLNDGTMWTLSLLSFVNMAGTGNPRITDPGGPCGGGSGCLQDGDLAVIYAQAVPIPEPSTWVVMATAFLCSMAIQKRMTARFHRGSSPKAASRENNTSMAFSKVRSKYHNA